MIRLLILILTCSTLFAQSAYKLVVGTAQDLVALTPGNIRAVTTTNGLGDFRWDATSLAATNTSTIFKPLSLVTGRWIYVSPGTVSGSSADRLATNGGTAYALKIGDATPSKAAALDANGVVTNATTTLTELNYISGLTSAVQAQLNAKAAQSALDAAVADIADNASDIAANTVEIGKRSRFVATISDLQALDASQITEPVIVLGYYALGDGGGGVMCPKAASVLSTNRGTVFAGSGTGRWEREIKSGIGMNVRWFGAKGDDATDDTVAIQAAIDEAGAQKTYVYAPFGVYRMQPGAWGDYVLLMVYCSYDRSTGLTSATKSTPYQETYIGSSMVIRGDDAAAQRLARVDTTPNETYGKGTVFKFVGDMAGKTGIETGHWGRNLAVENIQLVGTGATTNSIGIRHNVGSSIFTRENVDYQHFGIADDVGGDYLTYADAHADFNTWDNVRITYCGTGIKFNNYQGVVNTIKNSRITAGIGVHNPLSLSGTLAAPLISIENSFITGDTVNKRMIFGTVTAATSSNVTVTNLSKFIKTLDSGLAIVTNITSGVSITNVSSTNMFVTIEGNVNATGSARPSHWAVLNRVTNVNNTTWTIGLDGLVDPTAIIGATIYIVDPAAALWGGNFDPRDSRFEYTEDEDFGFSPMLAYLVEFGSSTTFRNCTFHRYSKSSPTFRYNESAPWIYQKSLYSYRSAQLKMENNRINVRFPNIEIEGGNEGYSFTDNEWLSAARFINHNGTLPDGVFRTRESTFLKFGTYLAINSGDEMFPIESKMGAQEYRSTGGLWMRGLRVSSSTPTEGTTGEAYMFGSTSMSVPNVIYRIGSESGVAGQYRPSAISSLATNDLTTPTRFLVSALAGIEDQRVIKIMGAGTAGAPLITRVVSVAPYDGTNKVVWVAQPAVTAVSGSAIYAAVHTNGITGGIEVPTRTELKVGSNDSLIPALRVGGGRDGIIMADFIREDITNGYGISLNAAQFTLSYLTNNGTGSYLVATNLMALNADVSQFNFGALRPPLDGTADHVGEMMFAQGTAGWATGRGAMVVYDGTSTTKLVGVLSSDTPSNGQVPTYNTGGTVTWETVSGAPSRTVVSSGTPTVGYVATAADTTGTNIVFVSAVPVANGGTGAGTLTGLVKGNGTSAMTAAVAGTDYVAPGGAGTVSGLTTANIPQATSATALGSSPVNVTVATNITVTGNIAPNAVNTTNGLTISSRGTALSGGITFGGDTGRIGSTGADRISFYYGGTEYFRQQGSYFIGVNGGNFSSATRINLDGTQGSQYIQRVVDYVFQAANDYGNPQSLLGGDEPLAKTANYTILVANNGYTFNNNGASGAITLTLPPATIRSKTKGVVVAAYSLKFKAAGSDVIRWGSTLSGAAGEIYSSTPGHTITLTCEVAGTWIADASEAWTLVAARRGNATLVGGAVTVANTTVTANTLVMHARKTAGGTLGNLTYTITAGTGFTINSDSGTDTSVVSWNLLETP